MELIFHLSIIYKGVHHTLNFMNITYTSFLCLHNAYSDHNFYQYQSLFLQKDFPFDTQCCEINLYSWAHTAEQMLILQYGNKNITNLTHLAQNTEWFIYNTCAMNSTIRTSANLKWWVTRYAIQIKRESIYHFYTLLMPCAVLSFCSILLFWLPPDSEEKITLGVTVLLAFFVNSLIVSNYTPEATFELPVIGKYYAFIYFLVRPFLAKFQHEANKSFYNTF